MKAVICGAGIGGLALAQRLDTIGWDVVVLERSPGPRTHGYMIDFFGPGYDAAEAVGVLPRLHEVGYVVTEMTYRDEEGRRRSGMYYDQVAQVELPQWSRDRVTLIGDACQAVSVVAGQGASLAIAAAYVLADRLSTAPSIDSALAEYERVLRPVVADKQEVARKGVRWFVPEARWQLPARRTALHLARLPLLDRYVADAVAGKPSAIIS
ncbi:FAD-dependent monooxygenase [Nonomuraea aurantiaca]|uniref:FAD-dependent monooxygenase n=1 Tax=Nonomuraea aurantiaca TaxID=2878562 RepID=UPI001CD99393|nr:FAD-dependent monooxygenase [Nonomuraea aurantiaca]MCA2222799.1 FAD-dependent monooxygenase [Nonomuraea aurantiaca]